MHTTVLMWNWMDGSGFGWGAGMIGMALFWVVVLVAVVLAVRALSERTGAHAGDGQSRESPLDVLKRRYARGEIDRTEFEEKRKDLT